ncbi:right-handed parallel beta-helix repeat-containing protein [Actinoplanes sp. NPDC049596]|uniref:glycosyl hydrolase family 28-related protein n=1 Tax=unclassified Actinoplanes TaxID=2626549 RepID=UPI0034414BBD
MKFKTIAGTAVLFVAAGVTASVTLPVFGSEPPAAAAAGASTPFTSFEAEAGTTNNGASTVSLTASPTTEFSSPALEASGHAYVRLAGKGQEVWWTNTTGHPVTALTVRASIPDSTTGAGLHASLSLLVDGAFRQEIPMTSTQSWLYEGNGNYNSGSQNPADGHPRAFFDDARALLTGAPIAPGSTFSLKVGAADTAAFYDIDVVDVEQPAELPQPAGSLPITECGASTDPATDSTAAIQRCIDRAQSEKRTLWIPAGTFYVKGTAGLHASGITITGAGVWYSTVYRMVPLPNPQPLGAIFDLTSARVEHFHLDANAIGRATADGAGGGMDTTGTDWVADDIWTQHTLSGFWASGTGGTVRNCRVTSVWADGINLNNVALGTSVGRRLTATNNFVRGTGDDATAINSVAYNDYGNGPIRYTPMSDITFSHNTMIAPWGGKGLGVYGGSGQVVSGNYIADTARYIGLSAGRFGVNGDDLVSATLTGNVVVRSGGNGYNQGQPAVHVGNGGDGQNTGTVTGVTVTGNTITDALYDAVGFSTSSGTTLRGNTIISPARNGIVVAPPFYPAPSGSALITGNTLTGLRAGVPAIINNSTGFTVTTA